MKDQSLTRVHRVMGAISKDIGTYLDSMKTTFPEIEKTSKFTPDDYLCQFEHEAYIFCKLSRANRSLSFGLINLEREGYQHTAINENIPLSSSETQYIAKFAKRINHKDLTTIALFADRLIRVDETLQRIKSRNAA